MLPGCAIGAVMAPISGQILDKLGAKKPIVTGILCCLTSMLLLLLFVHQLTVEMITYIFAIFAIGQALQMGNNFTVALGHLPEDHKADGNAVINTIYGHQRYFWRSSGFSAWSYRLGYEHPRRSSKRTLCACMRSLYSSCYYGNRALCTT